MKIERCGLFEGMPYIAEKDGKYHVLQGGLTADEIKIWYDTKEKAVEHWNKRVQSVRNFEKDRMGITRDIQAEYEYMYKRMTMQ